jgi:hypothetical protein
MRLIASLLVPMLMIPQGHGSLNLIYDTVEKFAAERGWDGVDIVIIGGDFQVCLLPNPSFHGQGNFS